MQMREKYLRGLRNTNRFCAAFILVLISLSLIQTSAFAQIDYNYRQFDIISTNNPSVKIDWIKSQINQSVKFDHTITFVNQSSREDVIGGDVELIIYLNNKSIYQKKLKAADHIQNEVYIYESIKLKKRDELYFQFTLLPNPNSAIESYIINIQDNRIIKRKSVADSVQNLFASNTSQLVDKTKFKEPEHYAGYFGEHYDHTYNSSSPKAKYESKQVKRTNNINGIINVLGFLFGM